VSQAPRRRSATRNVLPFFRLRRVSRPHNRTSCAATSLKPAMTFVAMRAPTISGNGDSNHERCDNERFMTIRRFAPMQRVVTIHHKVAQKFIRSIGCRCINNKVRSARVLFDEAHSELEILEQNAHTNRSWSSLGLRAFRPGDGSRSRRKKISNACSLLNFSANSRGTGFEHLRLELVSFSH